MSDKALLATLAPLGFTDLEARIYVALLRDSPRTGYAIARAIGKATANTYKAIDALAAKGAVLVDEGDTRLVRALAPEELIARLTRRFSDSAARAAEGLAGLARPQGDERVYQLREPEEVFERAAEMLGRAKRIVLLDVFPNALERIAPALRAALARKVEAYAHVYADCDIPGLVAVKSAEPGKRWPGEQLNVVVDAEEHLLALLAHDLSRVHQAVWSQSLFLSCMQHNHLACEIELVGGGKRAKRFERLHLSRGNPPGLAKLRRRM